MPNDNETPQEKKNHKNTTNKENNDDKLHLNVIIRQRMFT